MTPAGVVDLDRRATASTAALLDGTRPDQHPSPTPCDGWTVLDLAAHLVSCNVKYTTIARGGDWTRGAPEVVLDDVPHAVYRRTAATMLDAWRGDGVLAREIALPAGRGPAEGALFMHLGETLVHGWDLAVATGQQPAFDDDVVEASLAFYRSWLPAEGRGPLGAPFADARAVGAGTSPIERLAAFMGRDVGAWA